MTSNSALTCLPPTAARRTYTLFSAIVLIHLFVDFAHHYRLDCGEDFGGRDRADAEWTCPALVPPQVLI